MLHVMASPLPAPEMAKAERPPSHILAAQSSKRITTVGSGRSTFGNSWGTNADLALGPSWGQGGLGNWDVPFKFPKVLLPDPTVVILSPNRAAKMCDGGRSALAISSAGSGEDVQGSIACMFWH
jgi:hypothetical protein